jgi:hypothetical protein
VILGELAKTQKAKCGDLLQVAGRLTCGADIVADMIEVIISAQEVAA